MRQLRVDVARTPGTGQLGAGLDQGTIDSLELWDALATAHPQFLEALEAADHAMEEVGPAFLGFVSTYKALATIIPRTRTIYDFGCSYAAQAWYFRDHAGYVGVDPSPSPRLRTANARYFTMDAEAFVRATPGASHRGFAIVNYVPSPRVADVVKIAFADVFAFYPRGDHRGLPGAVVIGKP